LPLPRLALLGIGQAARRPRNGRSAERKALIRCGAVDFDRKRSVLTPIPAKKARHPLCGCLAFYEETHNRCVDVGKNAKSAYFSTCVLFRQIVMINPTRPISSYRSCFSDTL
jgi:hypothetical protein